MIWIMLAEQASHPDQIYLSSETTPPSIINLIIILLYAADSFPVVVFREVCSDHQAAASC
jgi:hypothetical protein